MAKGGKKTGEAVAALEHSPSHLLHRALQFALDLYADGVAADAPTQRQYAVLSAVAAREGLTQTDLVRATGIDRSTLADLVRRMISKELLVREQSPTDARAKAVRMSEHGREALALVAPQAAAADLRLLDRLPKGKRQGFIDALDTLARASDKARAKADKAVIGEGEADAAERKARKAEKKARKAQKAAVDPAAPEAAPPAAEDEAAKAARKARKAERKARKADKAPEPA